MIESIIEVKEKTKRKVAPTNIKIEIEIVENNETQPYIKEKMDKIEKEVLNILKEKVDSTQQVRVSDSSIMHYKVHEGENKYQVRKMIAVDLEANIEHLNEIIDALLMLDNPPGLSWKGYVKNIEEIEKELLTEAITKSVDKANHIATVLGKRVLGVKKISNYCTSGASIDNGCYDGTSIENYGIQIQEQTIYVEVFSEWYI